MSDASVATVLRSGAPLVVIEAPAGCGKTHQGAAYARDVASAKANRLLIITHTHAACGVFAERTAGLGRHVEIRTIDSLIAQIGAAYHSGLGLPADIATWTRRTKDALTQRMAAYALAASLGYFTLHALAIVLTTGTLPATPAPGPLEWTLIILGVLSFGVVAVAQAMFPLWAYHPAAAGLRVHLANGLYANAALDRLLGGWTLRPTR